MASQANLHDVALILAMLGTTDDGSYPKEMAEDNEIK